MTSWHVRSWLTSNRLIPASSSENGIKKKRNGDYREEQWDHRSRGAASVTSMSKSFRLLKLLSSGPTPERTAKREYFVQLFRNVKSGRTARRGSSERAG